MTELTHRIEHLLSLPLPGRDAQYLMAPGLRGKPEDYLAKVSVPPRESAVLLLLVNHPEGEKLVLTKRAGYKGVHGGQISFPGGKVEDNEKEDPWQTALREAEEEIGLDRYSVVFVGALTRLYIPPSNFWVNPFVGYLHETVQFVPHPREVDKIMEIPLGQITDPRYRKEKNMDASYGKNVMMPYFDLEGETVWGATAMILSEFAEILKKAVT